MDIDATRQKIETIWHFSSIFPRESYPGSAVWKRYNPFIIWPVETIRNIYLVKTEYSGSNEKMMLAYCQAVLNGIQNGKRSDNFLTIKGLNYNFFQMDWAFENSALLGKMSMSPSILGNVSNKLKLDKQQEYILAGKALLGQEIIDIYCKIFYPAITASGASIWFNLEQNAENHIEITNINGLKNIDIIVESLRCLCQKLQSFALGIDSNENDENVKEDIQTLIEKKVRGR
ncbi:hypothetical protein VB774_20025 [Pseudanabaena galeata UHCC 0370]|uniref:Uncharacterized protein n=1 Tax=Pseudanabaena galeata UHCC 0370 TaxID=3110310 RepID=A0ABU5TNN8_9CYAN|nr:hypothetical protein [Pseudanabaena galeata]MEA5479921.1 hypothetical protein [Pseudanabaena galeata UHCC 0370]